MEDKQLKLNADGSISEEGKRFVELHNEILIDFRAFYQFGIKMAKDLKIMRDEKLYLGGGYKTFEEYAETELGFKERQAYNYIKVVESYSEEFLQSNANLGITKLLLLAPLSEIHQKAFIEDAAGESVETLKKKIEDMKEESGKQLKLFEDNAKKDKKTSLDKLEKDHAAAIKKLNDDKLTISLERDRLQKELTDAAPAEVKVVADPKLEEKLKNLQADLNDRDSKLLLINKQLEIAQNQNMAEFKVKYADLQRLGKEIVCLIDKLDAEKKVSCKSAIASVVKGWNL